MGGDTQYQGPSHHVLSRAPATTSCLGPRPPRRVSGLGHHVLSQRPPTTSCLGPRPAAGSAVTSRRYRGLRTRHNLSEDPRGCPRSRSSAPIPPPPARTPPSCSNPRCGPPRWRPLRAGSAGRRLIGCRWRRGRAARQEVSAAGRGRAAGFRRECLTRPTPRHRHILSSCTSRPTPTQTTPHIQQREPQMARPIKWRRGSRGRARGCGWVSPWGGGGGGRPRGRRGCGT